MVEELNEFKLIQMMINSRQFSPLKYYRITLKTENIIINRLDAKIPTAFDFLLIELQLSSSQIVHHSTSFQICSCVSFRSIRNPLIITPSK